MASDSPDDSLPTNRLEALQDGVFAIVLTLLVLELKIPEAGDDRSLVSALLKLWPVFLSYYVTFINLGVYWVGQHNQFHYIKRTDRVFLWINLLFLMFVSILPFTTALLGRSFGLQVPYVLYGLHLIVIGMLLYWQWCYATVHHRLTSHEIKDELVRAVKRRILVAPVVSVLAILASFLSMSISLGFYLLLPLYYIWPGKVDGFWRAPAVPHRH